MSVPPPAPQPLNYSGAVETNQEAKTFGLLCHVSAFAGLIIPFGSIVGPLVFWLLKKDQHPFVNRHGKESLNFQISCFIYMIVAALTMFILIGFLLFPAVLIFWLVMTIIATIKASGGEDYRYPLTIRLVS